jgi:hypothetical protein
MHEGVDGLLRDQTRPSRIPSLPKAVFETVVTRSRLGPHVFHWITCSPQMSCAPLLCTGSKDTLCSRAKGVSVKPFPIGWDQWQQSH